MNYELEIVESEKILVHTALGVCKVRLKINDTNLDDVFDNRADLRVYLDICVEMGVLDRLNALVIRISIRKFKDLPETFGNLIAKVVSVASASTVVDMRGLFFLRCEHCDCGLVGRSHGWIYQNFDGQGQKVFRVFKTVREGFDHLDEFVNRPDRSIRISALQAIRLIAQMVQSGLPLL